MKKQCKMCFEGTVFNTTTRTPPKLVKLGSGEILRWCNTLPDGQGIIAEYKIAEVEQLEYVHNA